MSSTSVSSKRGRKRNDNLPPSRARDVQRAFRARRAAHLQDLEQRVAELEHENDCLREALHMEPASRPPLGKGPTGKDKPKTEDSSPTVAEMPLNSEDSSASPGSTHTHMSSRSSETRLDDHAWDQRLAMDDGQSDNHPSPPTYHIPPLSKPVPYNSYPSSSRNLSAGSGYQVDYRPPDRPIDSYPNPNFTIPHDKQRAYFSNPPAHHHVGSYDNSMRLEHNPAPLDLQSHSHRNPPLPFRREHHMSEPSFSHLPPAHYISHQQGSQGIRLPVPPRLQENFSNNHPQPQFNLPSLRTIYTAPDGRHTQS